MSRFRHWFELCRLPNAFTAVADPLAGAMVVGANWRDSFSIIALMLASGCLYTGGAVLNDWNDFKADLADHPNRPLPAGRIRRIHALLLAIALLGAGGVLASAPGPSTGRIGAILIGMIILYDVLIKELPVAPAALSICRSLNLLMGMMLIPVTESTADWSMRVSLAAMMGLYIFGLNLFALKENGNNKNKMLIAGCAITWLAALALGLLRFLFPKQTQHHTIGMVWLALLLVNIGYRMSQAVLTPEDNRIQLAVRTATFSIILFDAAIAACVRGLWCSLPIALLLIPAIWLEKIMQLEDLQQPVAAKVHKNG